MQYTTWRAGWLLLAVRLHLLVVINWLGLAVVGRGPACSTGWVALRQAQSLPLRYTQGRL
jgi:hypothetical protein